MPQDKRPNLNIPWWVYFAIGGLALLILRTGLSVPILLIGLAIFVVVMILFDRHFQRGKTNEQSPKQLWTTVLDCTVLRNGTNDEPETLSLLITNATDTRLTLPPMSLWLGYSTFAGGTPGRGGNGLDAIHLEADLPAGRQLKSHETIRIVIDSPKHRAQPSPLPRRTKQRKNDTPEAFEKRMALLDAAYADLCEDVLAAASLVAFIDGDSTFFLDLRADGQHPGWQISSYQITKEPDQSR